MSFTPDPQAPQWRDVHISAVARGVSVCGDFLAATALVLALQARGAGGMAVAGLLLASTVPLMLLAPVAGRLADRVDSRFLLVGVSAAQAVVCAVLAYTEHPLALIALVAVLAAGLAVTSPTFAALVPDMVGMANLPKAMAISQTANTLGMLAGPALAGVLVGQFGVRVPLLIDAASYLAVALAALMIRTRRGGRSVLAAAAADGADPGPWRARSDSLLFAIIVAVGVTIAAVTAVNVVDVFFVRETLQASETAYGLIGAVWTAGMLIGSWLAVRVLRGMGDGRVAILLLGLLAGTSAVLLVSAGVPGVWWLIPLWIIGGVVNGGTNVTAQVIVARRVPSLSRGRAIGLFVGIANGANVVGYLLGGVLLGVLEPRPLIAAAGAAGVLAVVACSPPVIRAARRLGVPVVSPEAPVTASEPQPAGAVAGGYRQES